LSAASVRAALVESAPESLADEAAASVRAALVESAPESLADEAAASGAADVEPEHATPTHAPSKIVAIAARLRATDTALILLERVHDGDRRVLGREGGIGSLWDQRCTTRPDPWQMHSAARAGLGTRVATPRTLQEGGVGDAVPNVKWVEPPHTDAAFTAHGQLGYLF
jgi:hypothetical protein